MVRLSIETQIAAPPEVCFDLARDIEFYAQSLSRTQERVLLRPANRRLALGDEVEFQGRHLGLIFRFTARITAFDLPLYFRDEMTCGPFRSFIHDHHFRSCSGGTLMSDHLQFAAPLGPLGWIAERLLLRSHLAKIIRERAYAIRLAAQTLPPPPETLSYSLSSHTSRPPKSVE